SATVDLPPAIETEARAWTIAEMSLAYHLGRTTLYAEIAAGRLEVVKVGRSTRILAHQRRTWEGKLLSSGGTPEKGSSSPRAPHVRNAAA
ncbi:MAG: hypothetical protein ABI142_01455, partial [Bryocella sp.]